jgi:hypothetical protein
MDLFSVTQKPLIVLHTLFVWPTSAHEFIWPWFAKFLPPFSASKLPVPSAPFAIFIPEVTYH